MNESIQNQFIQFIKDTKDKDELQALTRRVIKANSTIPEKINEAILIKIKEFKKY